MCQACPHRFRLYRQANWSRHPAAEHVGTPPKRCRSSSLVSENEKSCTKFVPARKGVRGVENEGKNENRQNVAVWILRDTYNQWPTALRERIRRHFGARGMSSVRYGIRLGDLEENWFLCFPIKHSTQRAGHSDEKIPHHEVGWSPLRTHPIRG